MAVHLLSLPHCFDIDAEGDLVSVAYHALSSRRVNLKFKCRSTAPKFRVLIDAYRDGDPLPAISGGNGRKFGGLSPPRATVPP